MRIHLTTVTLLLVAITFTACNRQAASNTANSSPTQAPQSASPTAQSQTANSTSPKNTKASPSPYKTVPNEPSNSEKSEVNTARCPEAKIPLCRELATSTGPVLGPGRILEGKDLDEVLRITKECYELKQKGCF